MGFQDAVNDRLTPNTPTSSFVGGTPSYYVPNAGLFGTGANLPGNSGPPDPFVEPTPLPGTQNYGPASTPINYAAYPPPGYGNILSLLDRYGVGGNGPTGGNSSQPGAGYSPTSIMQGYLDFYANNPSASGATAPSTGGGDTAYPAPGTGAPRQSGQSFLSRLLGSTPAGALINLLRGRPGDIPAVRLAQSLGHLFNPPQSVHDNASSNSTPGPPGGGIAGGAGITPTDQAYRFSNNGVTGNFQADQTTKAFELAGGYPGAPNRTGTTTDRGHDRFYNLLGAPFAGDPEGGFARSGAPNTGNSQRDSRWVMPSQAESAQLGLSFNADARNKWLMEHNPWYYNSIPDPNNPALPPTSISGPPLIGGGG